MGHTIAGMWPGCVQHRNQGGRTSILIFGHRDQLCMWYKSGLTLWAPPFPAALITHPLAGPTACTVPPRCRSRAGSPERCHAWTVVCQKSGFSPRPFWYGVRLERAPQAQPSIRSSTLGSASSTLARVVPCECTGHSHHTPWDSASGCSVPCAALRRRAARLCCVALLLRHLMLAGLIAKPLDSAVEKRTRRGYVTLSAGGQVASVISAARHLTGPERVVARGRVFRWCRRKGRGAYCPPATQPACPTAWGRLAVRAAQGSGSLGRPSQHRP